MRLPPAQIPSDDPEVLDKVREIRGRFVTRQPESLRCQRGIEHTLGLGRDLLSEIFKALAGFRAIVLRAGLSPRRM
jgi:hypothetical protein